MGRRDPDPALAPPRDSRPAGRPTRTRRRASARGWPGPPATPASITPWARDANSQLAPRERSHLLYHSIARSSPLSWEDWLAIARGEATCEEVAEARPSARRAAAGRYELISALEVALILGVGRTTVTVFAARPEFPRAVESAERASGTPVTSRPTATDARSAAPGGRAPGTSSSPFTRSGAPSAVRLHISERRFHLAPQLDGHADDNNYRYRDSFDAWLR
jgi:hypothetical protein